MKITYTNLAMKETFFYGYHEDRVMLNLTVQRVTERVIKRSLDLRQKYLAFVERDAAPVTGRSCLSCSNLAHVMAASSAEEKKQLTNLKVPNIGIVTAYNDMLSAHEPFAEYQGCGY
jgi:phosphogluconate dehydratase